MLDFRFDTFLTLCKVKNYTETAKLLHLTQPAVSQKKNITANFLHMKENH